MPNPDLGHHNTGKSAFPEGLPSGTVISPDTRRPVRLPAGQSLTEQWPVLDVSGPPRISLENWSFSISGLVNQPTSWNWEEFSKLERVRVFADFHCVTRWSRLGNLWEGVSAARLVQLAGGLLPEARHVLVKALDNGWTTNLPVSHLLADDVLIALLHDGTPLSAAHGGPARLVVPRLYAWKSAKWVCGFEFLDREEAGFWERHGYHRRGDPWREERFG